MARKPRTLSAPSWADDLIWLENLWDEPEAPASTGRGRGDCLQGAWQAISGRRKAELLVSGEHLTVYFADGDIYMGRFTLGDGAPATMDVTIEEGPAQHRGRVAHCIWELDGDTLRWCTAFPGQPDRPTGFEEADPRHLFLELKRVQIPAKG
jgi:uncharacterized protein (TIGR03067 family)